MIAIADPLDDLMHTLSMLSGPRHYALTAAQFDTLERVIEHMRGMLHQFAAGVYPDEAPLDAGALQDVVAIVRAHSALHDELTPVDGASVGHPRGRSAAMGEHHADRAYAHGSRRHGSGRAGATVGVAAQTEAIAVPVVEAAAPAVAPETFAGRGRPLSSMFRTSRSKALPPAEMK